MTLEILTHTELLEALETGKLEIVQNAIDQGIDLNAPLKNRKGDQRPLLHYSIANRYLNITRVLIEKGADVNAKDMVGWTPLLLATATNNYPMVRLLLNANACVHARNLRGETPLLGASFWGYADIVQLLIERGKADVNETNPNHSGGWTPLHKAAFQGWMDVVEILLRNGADPTRELHHPDGFFTPYKLAKFSGQEKTVLLFQNFGIRS